MWRAGSSQGPVKFTHGEMVGVELDTPLGKHNGTVKGEADRGRLMKCGSARGRIPSC